MRELASTVWVLMRMLWVAPFLAAYTWTVAVAEEVPRDVSAFTEAVAVELRQQVGEASVVVKGPLTLGLGDLQLNLDRIFAFCRGNAAGCRAQVDGYVKGAAETYRNVTAPPNKSCVRLVGRTSEYIETIRSVPDGT